MKNQAEHSLCSILFLIIFESSAPFLFSFFLFLFQFDSRIIAESYIFLRSLPFYPLSDAASPSLLASHLRSTAPCLLLRNYGVICTGSSLIQAFDRLELTDQVGASNLSLSQDLSAYVFGRGREGEMEGAGHL